MEDLCKEFPKTVTLRERFNLERVRNVCEWLKNNPSEEVLSRDNIGQKRKQTSQEEMLRVMFYNKQFMFQQFDDGSYGRNRVYCLRSSGDRRYTADGGLNDLESSLKDYIFSYSSSLDVENCYPNLLVGFLDRNPCYDIAIPCIRNYAENRGLFFADFFEFMKSVGIDLGEKDAKRFFSSIPFGRSLLRWKESVEKENNVKFLIPIPGSILSLEQEWREVRVFIVTKFPTLKPSGWTKMDVFELESKVVSIFMTSLETHQMLLLQTVVSSFGKQVVSWTYDGIDILNIEGVVEEGDFKTNEFLGSIREKLLDAGFFPNLNLKFKPKNDSWWVTTMNQKDGNLDDSFFPKNLSYAQAKEWAEDLNGPSIFQVHDFFYHSPSRDRVLAKVTKSQLVVSYTGLQCVDATKPFIDLWMKDESAKRYLGAGVFPNGIVPKGHINLWDGFWIEHVIIPESDLRDENVMSRLVFLRDRVLNHFRDMVDDKMKTDEHFAYLTKFLAHLFQYPGAENPPGVLNIICSKNEGNGKGIFEQIITQMIDGGSRKKSFSTSNIATIGMD